MRPWVIDELENDLCCFGNCYYYIIDNEEQFSINRIPPINCTIVRLEID